MKMWSGRSRQPLNSEFERWQRSFPFDKRLLHEEIAASSAHARALARIGVLSTEELQITLEALGQIGKEAAEDSQLLEDEEVEDIHHFVEKRLVERIGEIGYKLHSGRSRNEQIATDLRLYVRSRVDEIAVVLGDLLAAFLQRAEQAGVHAMPSYTHLQRAEPVLVAHWLLAYFEMLLRDAERLADCRRRVNICPLGSGAVAGSTLPLHREAIAKELNFSAPTANSMDATSDRDFAIELVNTLALLAVHLSRFSEEMILFSSQEFGFIQLPESYSTGSSAMPQKQNPDLLELIRGSTGRLIGNATALVTTLKGLPLAYNKDLQETQEPVFDSAQRGIAMVKHANGFLREVEFKFDRMQQAAESHFLNAFAAATYLARKGVPFRRAHEIIGAAVRICEEKKCELQDLSLSELAGLHPSFAEDFYRAMQLDQVLDCHDVTGGTARSRVKDALAHARSRLAQLRGEVHAHA